MDNLDEKKLDAILDIIADMKDYQDNMVDNQHCIIDGLKENALIMNRILLNYEKNTIKLKSISNGLDDIRKVLN